MEEGSSVQSGKASVSIKAKPDAILEKLVAEDFETGKKLDADVRISTSYHETNKKYILLNAIYPSEISKLTPSCWSGKYSSRSVTSS